MPFVESSQSLRSKLHLTQVSTPVLLGIIVLCVVAGVLAVQNIVSAASEPLFTVEPAASAVENESGAASDTGSDDAGQSSGEPATVVVFVSGCVAVPGVYELPDGSRVGEAVDAAGGFTEEAATDAVNLARVLSDGEQVAIVSRESLEASGSSAQNAAGGQESSSGVSGTSSASGAVGLVNINTADEAALETLPGIGPSTAQKIVADRDAQGPFASKEDIKRVSGIGDKKYEAIADLITV